MISYRISCFTPIKPSELNSRQQTALRRSQALIVRPSHVEFHQLSGTSNQTPKRDPDRLSPISVRRLRPTIEHFAHHRQPPTDLQDLTGSQINVTRLPPTNVPNKSPRILTPRCKPVQYSKSMPEKPPRPSLPLPIWTPILTRKQIVPFQTRRSKSILGKHAVTPYYHQFPSEKKPSTSDVFISPRLVDNYDDEEEEEEEVSKKSTVKDLIHEWEDQKSNVAVSSEDDDNDDDSIITNCNNPLLKFTAPHQTSTTDQFASPVFIPQQCSSSSSTTSTNDYIHRFPFHLDLPPVVEDTNDDID